MHIVKLGLIAYS